MARSSGSGGRSGSRQVHLRIGLAGLTMMSPYCLSYSQHQVATVAAVEAGATASPRRRVRWRLIAPRRPRAAGASGFAKRRVRGPGHSPAPESLPRRPRRAHRRVDRAAPGATAIAGAALVATPVALSPEQVAFNDVVAAADVSSSSRPERRTDPQALPRGHSRQSVNCLKNCRRRLAQFL